MENDRNKIENIKKNMEILNMQHNKVVKANTLTQMSRIDLTEAELDMVNFIVSLIKPQTTGGNQAIEYEFNITDYYNVLEQDPNGGTQYARVRTILKNLRDKSTYIRLPNGRETTVSWVNKVWADPNKNVVRIRLDEDVYPYILNQSKKTTRYELINALRISGKHGKRLYELCKSWEYAGEKVFDLADLKYLLNIQDGKYTAYHDFYKRVLAPAIKEINDKTDIVVEITTEKKERKITKIKFYIKKAQKIENSMKKLNETPFKINIKDLAEDVDDSGDTTDGQLSFTFNLLREP